MLRFLTILAIPVAFVLTALLSGSNEVTGAAFLSIFLIAGLGADVVLVFINFWERAHVLRPATRKTKGGRLFGAAAKRGSCGVNSPIPGLQAHFGQVQGYGNPPPPDLSEA